MTESTKSTSVEPSLGEFRNEPLTDFSMQPRREEFEEALAISEEIQRKEPAHLISWVQKIYMFDRLQRTNEANEAVRTVRRLAPNLRLGHVPGLLLLTDPEVAEQISEGLRHAGLPE